MPRVPEQFTVNCSSLGKDGDSVLEDVAPEIKQVEEPKRNGAVSHQEMGVVVPHPIRKVEDLAVAQALESRWS